MRYLSEHGFIDFDVILNNNYPNGLLIFKGSYVDKEFRNSGKFKEMVKDLFSRQPEQTKVHLATLNKNIYKMFLRLGFKEVDFVEYWNNTTNTIKLEGIITKELINNI